MFDAVAVGLRELPRVRLQRLPRMADFSKWAIACETAFWPAGTFARAYAANRRAAIEEIIDADPVAALVRDIMAERNSWTGSAAELWRTGAHRSSHDLLSERTGWPKSPRALAGRLRRAQTFLRALGIDITFSREGRAGSRIMRIRATQENTVSTVSSVCEQPAPRPAGGCDNDSRSDLVGRHPVGPAYVTTADDADGADANAGLHFS
jgi:hypothetical protein